MNEILSSLKEELLGEEMTLLKMEDIISFQLEGTNSVFENDDYQDALDNGNYSYYVDSYNWVDIYFKIIEDDGTNNPLVGITSVEAI